MNMMKIFSIVGILVLTGCAHVISKEALQDVDQDLSFGEILENPEAYTGKSVLLGGNIIETLTLPDKTLILVLQRPLGFRKRPATDGASEGRFIVESSGFLDPAIYSEGRKVTVVGSIQGKEVRPLGKTTYAYPVIAGKEIYLWPREEPAAPPRFYFGFGFGTSF
ncbi:MAG: Slp family lipoprotein [Desulfatiglandaceae bacterium]|jgi:outer membrane lipoprotein